MFIYNCVKTEGKSTILIFLNQLNNYEQIDKINSI
jgi:hypothetical protein